jgi:nucleotide-binding universal stress UspA family protein
LQPDRGMAPEREVAPPAAGGRGGRIVVGTDFSAPADVALACAAGVAAAQGAAIVLLHAAAPADVAAPDVVPVPVALLPELEARWRQALADRVARLADCGVAATGEFVPGAAADALVAAAARLDARLIVVGTRGLTAWQRVLVGSTAARTIRAATCPVLAVPPSADARAGPIRTVLFATDFSPTAARALAAGRRLFVPPGGAGVRSIVLHACVVPYESRFLPAHALGEAIGRCRAAAAARLAAEVAPLRRAGLDVETRVVDGDAAEQIVAQAAAEHVDVVAMGTHGWRDVEHVLLGSTAERVLRAAPCAVLTVRAAAPPSPPGVAAAADAAS